jgi:hypothetical protein
MKEDLLFKDPAFNPEDPDFYFTVLDIDASAFSIYFFSQAKQLQYASFVINELGLSESDLLYTILNDPKHWFARKEVREKAKSITVVYGGNHFALVPKSLYHEAYSKHYLEQVTLFEEKEELVYDIEYPGFYDTIFLFSIPKLLLKRAEFYYPEHFKVKHALQNIIETYQVLHQKLAEKFPFILFVYFSTKKMFICFTEGSERLLLLNQYEVHTVEDIFYYLLALHQQYEVAQSDTLLIMVGLNPHKDRLKSMIEKQYQKVLAIDSLFKPYTSPALVEAMMSAADFLHVFPYENHKR